MTSRYCILLIEDDPAVARSLQAGLEQEGFDPVWKNTGAEGVLYARERHPHLVLLDVRLPDGLGFDFCRQMRQQGLRQPVILLTVQQEETDKVLGLEMGADDYVTKPFSLRELVSRIRAQLRRAYGEYSAAQGELLYAGDLVIDQTSGQVRRGESALSLTPIEFRLLAYLARHPGQALSRAQILDAVWGYSPDLEAERTVNVHVRRLREKVELDPGRPALILTVPGIGYRLAVKGSQ
ncbi:MAG TPA: response regulator transcription factor [Anaerolineaceae bacterium]|nr:response regulator transcription factor [Anaerolineaceae bacterium]